MLGQKQCTSALLQDDVDKVKFDLDVCEPVVHIFQRKLSSLRENISQTGLIQTFSAAQTQIYNIILQYFGIYFVMQQNYSMPRQPLQAILFIT